MADAHASGAVPASRRVLRESATTRPFWQAASEGRLLLQFDPVAGRHQFYPRPIGLHTEGDELRWVEAKGTGVLIAITCCRVPAAGFETEAPYLLGIVRLDEGPRLLARIVTADSSRATVGRPVRLAPSGSGAFRSMVCFEPGEPS